MIVSLRNRHEYPSAEKLGKLFKIERASVTNRIEALIKKGYIIKEDGACIPTIDGIEQYMQDVMNNRFKR